MTVYIEYVVIDNFLVDYMLLKATFLITGKTIKKGRLLFCAFLGACFALLYPLMNFLPVILSAIKILMGLLLLLLSNNFDTFKSYYVNAVVFFLLTFALGGAILGASSIFNIDANSELSIAVMFLPAYLLIRSLIAVIKYVYSRKNVESKVVKCQLKMGEKVFSLRGFYDTGNGLYDHNSPVVICNKSLFKKILSGAHGLPKIRQIPLNTIVASGKITVIKIDELKIYNGQDENIFNNVTLGVAPVGVGEGYDLILHPDLAGEVVNENVKSFEKSG